MIFDLLCCLPRKLCSFVAWRIFAKTTHNWVFSFRTIGFDHRGMGCIKIPMLSSTKAICYHRSIETKSPSE
jgi:hypothetical protein